MCGKNNFYFLRKISDQEVARGGFESLESPCAHLRRGLWVGLLTDQRASLDFRRRRLHLDVHLSALLRGQLSPSLHRVAQHLLSAYAMGRRHRGFGQYLRWLRRRVLKMSEGGGAQRRGARAEFQPDDSGRLGLLKKATNFELLLASNYIYST